MPKLPPNIKLRGHKDYLEYVAMKATLRSPHKQAEADPYSDFAVTVQETIEEECPFVLRGRE